MNEGFTSRGDDAGEAQSSEEFCNGSDGPSTPTVLGTLEVGPVPYDLLAFGEGFEVVPAPRGRLADTKGWGVVGLGEHLRGRLRPVDPIWG